MQTLAVYIGVHADCLLHLPVHVVGPEQRKALLSRYFLFH